MTPLPRLRLLALPVLAAAGLACSGLQIMPDRWYPVDAPRALIISKEAAAIVDTRPEPDYDTGHAPGAMSIPLSQLWMRMDELPPRYDAVILIYDDEPGRVERAAMRLQHEGYIKVYALTGGLSSWRAAGGPISLQPAPPPGYGRGRETW
jgi:rhodanese-related sulfurtransferase